TEDLSNIEEFRKNGQDCEYLSEFEEDDISNQGAASILLQNNKQRKKSNKKIDLNVCVFCKNNGENELFYRSHLLKYANGRVQCPVLREYVCPKCGGTGDTAHTTSHCPLNSSPKINESYENSNFFERKNNIVYDSNYNEINSNNINETKSKGHTMTYNDLENKSINDDRTLTSNYYTKTSQIIYHNKWPLTINHYKEKPISLSYFIKSFTSDYDERQLTNSHHSNIKRFLRENNQRNKN
ncbi:hypothetical protein M0802_012092, partial [Mischocyttarus mexicanus]